MKANKEPAVFHRLWMQLSRRRRRQFFLVLGTMLLGAMAEVISLGAVLPFLAVMADPSSVTQFPVVQQVLGTLGIHESGLLIVLASLFALAAVLAAVLRITLAWASNRYVFLIGHDLGMKLFEHVLYQPYQWQLSRNSSETIADVSKVQAITNSVFLPLIQSTGAILIGVCIILALLYVSPVVTLIAFSGFGFVYYLVALFTRSTLRANGRVIAAAQRARVQGIQEALGGIRDVLLDGSQRVFLKRFGRVDVELREAQATSNLIGSSPRFLIEAAGMVLISGLALMMTQGPGGFVSALPVLGALALGSQRLLPLMQLVYAGWAKIVASRRSIDDLLEILERPLPTELKHTGQPLAFEREIRFRGVSFNYGREHAPVLHEVDFQIAKGERIGVVGKTGSGKSTLVDILMGLLEPTAGAIEIDGVKLVDATRRAWQQQIAHVPQAIFLADASIAENIAFGVENRRIDMDRVRDAARRSEVAEFIESLPNGYETLTGERGVRLSGGQRQRLGIARALYKNAQVLILDEATSALDNETEAAVMRSIEALARDLTVVIIAHRLSTLQSCDRILRLEGGKQSWSSAVQLGAV